MRLIKRISKEDYQTIKNISKNNPLLFSKIVDGFHYSNENKFSDTDKEAFNIVSNILKNIIEGFSSFNNFCLTKDKLKLRFQYNYGYEGGLYFIGIGYILLDELLNGFEVNKKLAQY